MKILEIIPSLNIGGAETFVVNISNEFVRKGHECKIVTFFNSNSILEGKLSKDIEKICLGKSYGFDLRCLFTVLLEIKKYKPNIVHAHIGAIAYLLIAAIFCKHCKFYATIHSEASREAGNWLTRTTRRFLFKFKLVTPITISQESMLSFQKFYGITPQLIYNGVPDVDIEEYESYNKLIFVHPASCQPVKNQKLLLATFKKLVEKYDSIELHWYGSHNQFETLFNELTEYLSERIIYKGITSELRKYLKNARAMCLSSSMEGMPMTIIEAMSVGCIPVSTPVGGCVNMIENGVNGFLSDDLSLDAYASVIEEVINLSDSQLNNIRNKARSTYLTNYTIDVCAKSYLNLFTRR